MAEQEQVDNAFYEGIEDWDFDEDVDFENLRIFDDTERKATEIIIHHDIAQQLQELGFDEVNLTFIPDAVPKQIEKTISKTESSCNISASVIVWAFVF